MLIFRGGEMIRAEANIAKTNLVYNMCRLVQIKKCQPNLIMAQWAECQLIIITPSKIIANNSLSNGKKVVSLHS